jgi:3-hydroxyacyl-CoA dehydrogenase
MTEIHRVGVIGGGQMGSGIAHVCALVGMNVTLNDLSDERISSSIAAIKGNMARRCAREGGTERSKMTEHLLNKSFGRVAAQQNERDCIVSCVGQGDLAVRWNSQPDPANAMFVWSATLRLTRMR